VVNNQSKVGSMRETQTTPRSQTWLVASLQPFACYADNPAQYDRQAVPVPIHTISPERITMRSISDLRIGAIVRLRIPAVGWRHVEICWLEEGETGCIFLLPLLPYELRAALNYGLVGRNTQPPQRGKPALAGTRRPIKPRLATRSRAPGGGRSSLIPNAQAAGHTLVAAIVRICTGAILAAPYRGALGTA
jgi:hypothetical protein